MRIERPCRYILARTAYLHDARLYRLCFAYRGVFWNLHLLSGYESDSPGFFIVNHEPMTLREIQHELHCISSAEEKIVESAIKELIKASLLGQHKKHGWYLSRWEQEQSLYMRETAAERQRRSRANRKHKAEIAAGQVEAGLRLLPRDR